MEKRKMLTFSVPAQILIETVSSGFLLVCTVILTDGALNGSQTRTGAGILAVFAVVFAVGGILGLLKCMRKYKAYKSAAKKR